MSDLQAYFDRVGYSGPRSPTLETLQALHRHHPQAIPFENLDVLLGRGISLAPGALADKLIRSERGGYCYEHNLLFCAILRELGFVVRPLLARVRWGAAEHEQRPRTHMLLQVTVAGRAYFADVGFGGLSLTAPVRAQAEVVQQTPLERVRMVTVGERATLQWELQVELHGSFQPVYRFDLQEQEVADYELANHWSSTHPSSRFRKQLVLARCDQDRRHTLSGAEYTVHFPNGESRRTTITEASELYQLLRNVFRVRLADSAELAALLARTVDPAS